MQLTILSTMIGPLWARASLSQVYPDLLADPEAVRLFDAVVAMHPEAEAEFAMMHEFVDELLGLSFLIRARTFDDAIRRFLVSYPEATVVNIGCGLDTAFSRVDNGRITWYDLDLPEAVAYRRKLILETRRSTCIPKSVFDYSWFSDANFSPEKGIFFFAGGLFNYFQEDDISGLCKAMAQQFPGGQLMFDAPSRLGNRIMNRRFKKYGAMGIEFSFGLGNPPKQIPRWSAEIELVDWFSLYSRVERNPKWRIRTRVLMRICDWLKVVEVAHLRFHH